MEFHNPHILLLFPLIPFVAWLALTGRPQARMLFPLVRDLKGKISSWRVVVRKLMTVVWAIAATLMLVALARPQRGVEGSRVQTEGIDILLLVDVSGSMRAEDFFVEGGRVNRLEAVKRVVEEFALRRQDDQIGMIVYAVHPYTQCPLTTDYGVLLELLKRAHIGMIEDGTAIGSAIAAGLNRLRESDAKSKVMILLTDGRNNAGRVDPLTAADLAREVGVKIYTIGAGSEGYAPYPMKDFFGNVVYQRIRADIDEEMLTKIAQRGQGEYFRATDTESLRRIYRHIDALEKTKRETKMYTDYHELFPWFLIGALALLIVHCAGKELLVRSYP